ncbi:hypothetical protein KFK09_008838 [Dendrobium nobile]|uniref:PB1 domain-containing protein n=1 Tax=Dendrobium nobile TaxID=94219 RepID=A0A8T3BQP5_DENNO|nr:hypothetical protein KFK09_008838 [Dendrobium nobile]
MATAVASACAVTMMGLLHSFRKYLHKPPATLPSSPKKLLQPPVKLPCSPFHPTSIYFNSPTSKYPFFPLAVSPLINNRNPSSTTIPPKAKHGSSRKVNIRCRFGGKLMPRLSDGALHYVGGRTRITDFRRDLTLQELYCKMEEIYGGPANICYKLPDQNLDRLVSISSAEDLDNMLNKYDYLKKTAKCGYPRLHVFLFPLSNRENSLDDADDAACNNNGLSCIEEVNGATKAHGFKTYKNDGKKAATSMLRVDNKCDGNGNENTSVPEYQSFLVHSNINDKINVIPQIINPPNDALYVLPTYEEPRQIHDITPSSFAMAHEPQQQNHQLYGEFFSGISNSNSIFQNQDPRNVPGPSSNNDSYVGHFRHTREPRQIHYITPSSFAMANVPQPQNHQFYGEVFPEISDSNPIIQNQDPWNIPGPSNIDSYFGHFRHTREPRQMHYITPSSFAMTNVPQLQNHQLFGEVFPEISDTNSIFQNQDPWNVPGPSNIDSYFGHFRHTRDIGTYEADEDLCNIVELVESVLQYP